MQILEIQFLNLLCTAVLAPRSRVGRGLLGPPGRRPRPGLLRARPRVPPAEERRLGPSEGESSELAGGRAAKVSN